MHNTKTPSKDLQSYNPCGLYNSTLPFIHSYIHTLEMQHTTSHHQRASGVVDSIEVCHDCAPSSIPPWSVDQVTFFFIRNAPHFNNISHHSLYSGDIPWASDITQACEFRLPKMIKAFHACHTLRAQDRCIRHARYENNILDERKSRYAMAKWKARRSVTRATRVRFPHDAVGEEQFQRTF